MKFFAFGLATLLLAGTAVAQQRQPSNAPPQSTVAPRDTTRNDDNATTQDHNPAVATTSNANDTAVPSKGSNSFTEGQAKGRIADRGYANVSDLKKDDNGIWRGTAQHDGQPVQVWLDYKGNVGEMH